MKPAKPTPIVLANDYLLGKKRHAAYAETVKIYNDLRVHIEGEYPEALISERRPNESEKIWKFRKTIYQPITKDTPNRVITSLGKIRRSPDWAIKYPETKVENRILEAERLSLYLEKNYPYHISITNWAFKIMLKNMIGDPNAVMLVMPINIAPAAGEYYKPIPLIFHSPDVLAFEADKFAVLKYKNGEVRKGSTNNYLDEQKFIIATPETIQWVQVKNNAVVVLDEFVHNLGYLPVKRLGGVYCKTHFGQTVYESFIDPMLPYLNEAAREYSDHQAEILQHIFSETWEWASQNCNKCKNELGISIGQIKSTAKNATGKTLVKCPDCNGTGISPYNKLIIRPAKTNMGEQAAPIPPKGFIEKDTTIARLQDERIEKHRYRALASINFQFLDRVPLAESGISKEVDRDELNNFVYNVAEVVVENVDWVVKVTVDYRYSADALIPNATERHELLPTIPVPQKFDLVTTGYLIEEFSKAKTANMSGLILSAMEEEFVAKKFIAEPELLAELQLIFKLDPIPNRTTDEKMVMLQNKAITKEAYIISSNITAFVKKAIIEKEGFAKKKTAEQWEILKVYAAEIIAENESVEDVIPTPPAE